MIESENNYNNFFRGDHHQSLKIFSDHIQVLKENISHLSKLDENNKNKLIKSIVDLISGANRVDVVHADAIEILQNVLTPEKKIEVLNEVFNGKVSNNEKENQKSVKLLARFAPLLTGLTQEQVSNEPLWENVKNKLFALSNIREDDRALVAEAIISLASSMPQKNASAILDGKLKQLFIAQKIKSMKRFGHDYYEFGREYYDRDPNPRNPQDRLKGCGQGFLSQ